MDFWRFGAFNGELGVALSASYDVRLVVLSVVVASLGAATALAVVDRLVQTGRSRTRTAWHLAGSLSMGLGVWAMHFTGMLAFTLPVSTRYDLATTVASAVPAILGSAVALAVMSRAKVEWWRLQLGGLSLAVGIGLMHYVGMEGVRAPVVMRYVPSLFVLSILVAHLLATSALYIRFFRQGSSVLGIRREWLSVVGMGLAVSGMHYTAMSAARFYPRDVPQSSDAFLPPDVMGLTIFIVVALFLTLALLGALFDQRLSAANQTSRDSDARHRAALETMADGLVAVDTDGRVTTANPAAETMFRMENGQLLGALIGDLIRTASSSAETSAQEAARALLEGCESCACVAEGVRGDGTTFAVDIRTGQMVIGRDRLYSVVLRDISESQAAEKERQRLAMAVEQSSEGIVITDPSGVVQYVNPSYEVLSGFGREDLVGTVASVFEPDQHQPEALAEVWTTLEATGRWMGTFCAARAAGESYEVDVTISCVNDETGEVTNHVVVERDVTAQRTLERQLAQAQKLESIGQLAAGIAHEINTPTQYVGDNVRFLEDAFSDLDSVLKHLVGSPEDERLDPPSKDSWTRILEDVDKADVEYLADEIPQAIRQSLEGIERVSTIVRAMKEFSHPSVEKRAVDLNAAIASTVTVASNEWKYIADCETDLASDLPPVTCVPGEFNQVILNMIVNASHAIADVVGDGSDGKGRISITTRGVDGWAEIVIADTGGGMPDHVVEKVFDPFFTTKEVGKGTGQGLSIAHSVIVQNHEGTIDVDSRIGEGTTFRIRLPLESIDGQETSDRALEEGVIG